MECRCKPAWLLLGGQWRLMLLDSTSRRNALMLSVPSADDALAADSVWTQADHVTFEVGLTSLQATALRLPEPCVAFHSLTRLSQETELDPGVAREPLQTMRLAALSETRKCIVCFELGADTQTDAFAHLLPGLAYARVVPAPDPASFPAEAHIHKHFKVATCNAVCASPDGRFLASGGADGVVVVHLAFPGAKQPPPDVLRIVAHKPEHGGVRGLCWHSSGALLSHGQGGAFVWNLNAFVRQQLLKFEVDSFNSDEAMDRKLSLREARLAQVGMSVCVDLCVCVCVCVCGSVICT
jgi:hypothetical protein